MKSPWANISLVIILSTLLMTGYFGLVNGQERAAWRLWLHGAAAYALMVLFVWKSQIIWDAYGRKKRWTRPRITFAIMLTLLLVVVFMGLFWVFYGPLYLGGFSLLTLHIYIALPVMALVGWHLWRMRFILKVKGVADRRLFVGTAVSAVVGAFLWWSVGRGKEWVAQSEDGRRFTGSYEQGSFTGRFPTVSWLFDSPDPIDITTWKLVVDGAVARPLSMGYEALTQMTAVSQTATLDCTGGWYSTQVWQGVPLRDVLAEAGLLDTAESITAISISHYRRRFALAELDGMLLAYIVGDEPLVHGHGAPLRLVVPHRRGYDWVKWVTHIHVNTTSAIWQSPLPLR
jgi:hypothetical protein